jgi:hypothetical protein
MLRRAKNLLATPRKAGGAMNENIFETSYCDRTAEYRLRDEKRKVCSDFG